MNKKNYYYVDSFKNHKEQLLMNSCIFQIDRSELNSIVMAYHGLAARLEILCRFVLCKSFRFLNALALNALVRAEPFNSTSSLPYDLAVTSSISPSRILPGKTPRYPFTEGCCCIGSDEVLVDATGSLSSNVT